jgi:hypothetical protein
MIIFELGCARDHRFEGWFASAGEFDVQRERRLLQCPVCGTSEISKIPHAKISVSEAPASQPPASLPVGRPAAQPSTPEARFRAAAAFVQQVMAQTEDVGQAFPEEARRIHYEETPSRAIRGQASIEETRELLEEGIEVLPLPLPPADGWN